MAIEHEVLVVPDEVRCMKCGYGMVRQLDIQARKLLVTCFHHTCDHYDKELVLPLPIHIAVEE